MYFFLLFIFFLIIWKDKVTGNPVYNFVEQQCLILFLVDIKKHC